MVRLRIQARLQAYVEALDEAVRDSEHMPGNDGLADRLRIARKLLARRQLGGSEGDLRRSIDAERFTLQGEQLAGDEAFAIGSAISNVYQSLGVDPLRR